jgi:hypothetical protein
MSHLALAWRTRVHWNTQTLAAAGGMVLVRSGIAFTGYTPHGRAAWTREFPHADMLGPLCVMGDSLFVGPDPVTRVDARTGRALARRRFDADASPTAAGAWVGCSSGRAARAWLLDPKTLEIVASCPDPEERVAFHDGLFCERARGGYLVVRDAMAGTEARVPEPADALGHVHHGSLVCFFTPRGRQAVELGSGRTAWSVDAPATGVPYRWQDLALVPSTRLEAYDLATGELAWAHTVPGDPLQTWRTVVEGRLVLCSGSAIEVLEARTGSRLASLNVELTVRQAVPAGGGLVAVLGQTGQGDVELLGLRIEGVTV